MQPIRRVHPGGAELGDRGSGLACAYALDGDCRRRDCAPCLWVARFEIPLQKLVQSRLLVGCQPDTHRCHRAPDRLNLCTDFLVARRNAGAMSAFGTKRTFEWCQLMSAFGGKADIMRTCRDCRLSEPDLTLAWFEDQSEDTCLLSCVSPGW